MIDGVRHMTIWLLTMGNPPNSPVSAPEECPMRDAVEKLIGDAVTIDLLAAGSGCGSLVVDEVANCLLIR